MNIVGQNQEFWMTDAGKRHFEERCIQYNYTLFIWVLCRDQRKWTILVGEQCTWEQFIEVSLYIIDQRSRGSSVSIVSDYGLDDREIRVRSPAGTKEFSSNLCVQTGSGAHPASCTMGTGGPFPGAKRGPGMTLTTQPHLVPRSRMSRGYTSSPPKRHHGV
jgi:hypothetical protein